MRVRGFDFSDIIRWEIVWIRNILIYDISYNTFMGVKQFCIRFNKVNGFIKTFDKMRYFVLYDYERYNEIYGRTKYLISKKMWYDR